MFYVFGSFSAQKFIFSLFSLSKGYIVSKSLGKKKREKRKKKEEKQESKHFFFFNVCIFRYVTQISVPVATHVHTHNQNKAKKEWNEEVEP